LNKGNLYGLLLKLAIDQSSVSPYVQIKVIPILVFQLFDYQLCFGIPNASNPLPLPFPSSRPFSFVSRVHYTCSFIQIYSRIPPHRVDAVLVAFLHSITPTKMWGQGPLYSQKRLIRSWPGTFPFKYNPVFDPYRAWCGGGG